MKRDTPKRPFLQSRELALRLLTLPYSFTQDRLMDTKDFIKAAEERGHKLTLDDLQYLHSHRLLMPLYRVSDHPVEGRKIELDSSAILGMNARGWTLHAASEGRLRDCSEEGYSAAWPYARPDDEDPSDWWNGFIYSSWQLLQVDHAINDSTFIKADWKLPQQAYQRIAKDRRVSITLAALSAHYLPSILGQLSLPSGIDERELRKWRASVDVGELLELADFAPSDLQEEANLLLLETHDDPLGKWLSLVRHSSYRGWSKLQGEPLAAMWRRVAAEMLLRAHEDLATQGVVDPLPDLTGAMWHSAQHDRLTPRHEEAKTLEAALAELGLSPHPKVLLLVEGETERYHFPKLLAEFGIGQPHDVRVQHTKGSRVNPQLIARYNITPRVGRRLDSGWRLDASSTALLVVMDPENYFETEADREKISRTLKEAIKEEVRLQGADINQDELDFLVRVRVWGDDKYELANFTDDELVAAVTQLARGQHNARVESPTWESDLRGALQDARAHHKDIKVAFWPLRVREDKVQLAKLLWPALRDKCEKEYVTGDIKTPALKIVLEARELVGRLSGTFLIGTQPR